MTENPLSLRLLSFRNTDKGRRLEQIPVRSIGAEGWPDPRLVSRPPLGHSATFCDTDLQGACFPPVPKALATPLLRACAPRRVQEGTVKSYAQNRFADSVLSRVMRKIGLQTPAE